MRLPGRTHLRLHLSGAVLASVVLGGSGHPPAELDAIRAVGAVGVPAEIRDGDRHRAVRAGVADLRDRGPVPLNSYYRIGSTVVMRLAGEGRLRLTDTVERRLPGLVRGNGNDGPADHRREPAAADQRPQRLEQRGARAVALAVFTQRATGQQAVQDRSADDFIDRTLCRP
ncbi:hypothetical protein [Catenuloplanes atrovinosus]|uniref:Uncharacterized protein n=1 Tax=Catenuloplanes atrovinosus TaxID=137266 RepID=A0AAE3YRH5_9ACTN|nr:hypothetical protein [Catenuloplanes atrovinosus]MDR7277345.1 hypothetical protein [Catenuloplanes atrovinosus]